MSASIQDFGRTVGEILKIDSGREGRERVRLLLEEQLGNPSFVEAELGEQTEAQRILYQDGELGFVILGHAFDALEVSEPHDHGACWTIYGQAVGMSIMDEWEIVTLPSGDERGRIRRTRTCQLMPGEARTYHVGDIHSPTHSGVVKLLRIECGPSWRA